MTGIKASHVQHTSLDQEAKIIRKKCWHDMLVEKSLELEVAIKVMPHLIGGRNLGR